MHSKSYFTTFVKRTSQSLKCQIFAYEQTIHSELYQGAGSHNS